MNGIDRIISTSPASAATGVGASDSRSAATDAIGEIGHRALAWVSAVGGSDAGSAAWTGAAGRDSGFRPDTTVLERRGDVYGLNGMAGDIGARFGATPTQEGALRRALENFTRQAVVQIAGLSGASGERQVAGIGEALSIAGGPAPGGGVDDVVTRIEQATAHLAAQNGA